MGSMLVAVGVANGHRLECGQFEVVVCVIENWQEQSAKQLPEHGTGGDPGLTRGWS